MLVDTVRFELYSPAHTTVGPRRRDGKRVPIPQLEHGMLPAGIHDCSLDELAMTFGQGRSSTRRAELWARFTNYCSWLASMSVFSTIYVDGSFTTAVEEPGDVDIVVATELDPVGLAAAFRDKPDAIKVIIAEYTKPTFGVHAFVAFGSPPIGSTNFVDFFQTVRPETAQKRGLPRDYRKGLLRVQL
jgi:hypothetical protein